MGRTPMIAPCIREFVPLDQLVTYAEACLRVYNRYGRRDNKYKARIKILVAETGAETFRDDVDDVMEDLESYVDGGGFVVFGLGALGVMGPMRMPYSRAISTVCSSAGYEGLST